MGARNGRTDMQARECDGFRLSRCPGSARDVTGGRTQTLDGPTAMMGDRADLAAVHLPAHGPTTARTGA